MSRLSTGILTPAGALSPGLPETLGEALTDLDLDGGSLWLASELLTLVPKLEAEERELLRRGLLALLAVERSGSTRLPLPGGEAEVTGTPAIILESLGLGGDEGTRLRALLEDPARCGALVGGPDDPPRPLLWVGDTLCLRRTHQAELGLATRLRERLRAGMGEAAPPTFLEAGTTRALEALGALDEAAAREAIEQAVARAPSGAPELTDEQRAACVAALCRPLTVITGGPGTGKTTVVATILRALALSADEALPAVALTAPTGKAADRLDSVVRSSDLPGLGSATTLHRLLGYRPRSDRFLHHEQNPLPAALVICDEASMIDLQLMDRLLRALLPGARLLLLGDADQLPPVGAGAVLRDLCETSATEGGPLQRLTRSHRQSEDDPGGAAILRAAACLREGDPASLLDPEAPLLQTRESPPELRWEGAEHQPAHTEAERRAFLAAWEARHHRLPPPLGARLGRPLEVLEGGRVEDADGTLLALLDHHEKARILCLTRVPAGGTGTLAINAHFERRLAARAGRAPSAFAAGTPVMVTRNDYAHGLFNGDAGLVLLARLEGGAVAPMVLFQRDEGLRAFSLGSLADHLEAAWAITVHKAQGSEYDEVAILLPAVEVRLLSREILYTAFTRARHSVVLVGDARSLERSTAHRSGRRTGLADLLAAT